MAIAVYWILSPLELFASSWQDMQVSDSQYYLYESRRFIFEDDVTALFSTWGSFVPVLFGAIALKVFGGSFIGIVFANCLLYTSSVFFSARLLGIPKQYYRFLPLMGFLPMQSFYNSMLSKEPIYLFLIVVSLYACKCAVETKRISWRYLFIFAGFVVITIIFRPAGAMILGLVALILAGKHSGFSRVSLLFVVFAIISAVAVTLANYMDYTVPLFFIGGEGELNFSSHTDLSVQRIESKQIPESLAPLFLPPWSVIASPLLGPLWMVSPLPLMGQLMEVCQSLFAGSFSFSNFAVMVRYLDAIMIVLLAPFLLRAQINRTFMLNPLVLFGSLQVFSVVAFQFFESGRHRYLPGFILAMIVISIVSHRRNKRRSMQNKVSPNIPIKP